MALAAVVKSETIGKHRVHGKDTGSPEVQIALLSQRIAELTEEGMNLAGVRRVLELEAEVARLQAENRRLREGAKAAVAEVERRHRRDLVPLRQAVAVFGERASILDPNR